MRMSFDKARYQGPAFGFDYDGSVRRKALRLMGDGLDPFALYEYIGGKGSSSATVPHAGATK
jgi:hypothetical protein